MSNIFSHRLPSLICALLVALSAQSIQAQSLYWDTNGFGAGAGPGDTASGTWDTTTTNWSQFNGGNGSTQTWTQNYIAVFAAGSSATGNSTITLASPINIGGITIEEGHFTFTGDSFTPREPNFTVYSGASATINATSLGVSLEGGTGDVYATGAQTYYEGGFRVTTSGTLHVNLGTTDQVSINLLSVSGGGTLNIGSGTDLLVRSSAAVGDSGNGTLNLDGAGTSVTTTSSTTVGYTGTNHGTLTVSDGAAYTAQGHFYTGVFSSGASGTVTVTGSGSSLVTNNEFVIGQVGTGSLTVESGGTVTANAGLAFGSSGGTGTLHLNAGGTLEVGGVDGLAVGETGTATIDAAGGTLRVVGSDLTTPLDMALADATDTTVDTNSLNATLSGVLSGTGALTKSGAGTLTLSGTNDYSGGTTVSAGTLTGNTASVQGDIINNAAVVFDQAATGTYAGSMSGTGSLDKTGAGNLTLSGNNSYAGGTTVSAGTLSVTNDANLGTASGTLAVSSGATLATGGDFRTNRAITLDGSGTHLANNGELIIGFGGTGSLALTNDATASLYNLDLAFNGGTGSVDVSSGAAITAANVIFYTGSSSVNLNAGGTLTTAGISGTGILNLNGGTLRSGAAYSTAHAATFTNASTVDTNGYNTTLSGILSGTGSLTKTGAGTLTLSGANSYSGGTTISAGTLTGNTGSLQGEIVNHAAVVFDQAATGTYAGDLSGIGSLAKTGAGNLTLSGNNSYSGGTTVSAGTLTIASDANLGDSAGSVAVSGGATLSTGNFFFNRAVTLDGSGTLLTNGNGELVVGYNGTGSLALTNDATASTYNLSLAFEGGTGTVDISSGASLTVNNNTAFGSASSTLNLNAGGTLTTSGISGTGILNLNGGTLRSGGAFSTAHAATLSNSSTIDTNGHATTLSGILTGDGSLAKTGAGTLTLSSNNDYSGGTTVAAGTLQLGNGGTTGSVAGNITNNGALVFNRSDDYTYNGVISGTGGLTQDGYILRFTQAQTYTGATTISGNYALVLAPTVDQGLSAATTVDVGTGTIFDFSNRSLEIAGLSGAGRVYSFGGSAGHLTVNTAAETSFDFSGVLGGGSSNNFAFTKTGAGTQILSGTNNYTGSTTINGGTLQLGNGGTTGSITTTTITNHGTLAFNRSDDLTYSGVVTGTGSLTQAGSGTLTLSGANDYSGGTTISDGTLAGDTFSLQGDITNNSALVFNQSDDATFTSVISGTGSVTKSGAGDLILSQGSAASGSLTISAGTLRIGTGSTASLGASSIVNDGMLIINSSSDLSAGNLTGSGSLTKIGTGTLTLSGTNDYAGGTSVTAGTLAATGVEQLGTGAISVTSGGAVELSAPAAFTQSLTVDGNGSQFNGVDNNSPELELIDPAVATSFTAQDQDITVAISNGGTFTGTAVSFGAVTGQTADIQLTTGGTLTASRGVGLGGDGDVTFSIDGAGSKLAVGNISAPAEGNLLIIGFNTGDALSSLSVGNGGTVEADNILIGFNFFSSATTRGALTINAGGTVTAGTVSLDSNIGYGEELTINSGGTLTIVGGLDALRATEYDNVVSLNGGTVQLTTNAFSTSAGAILGAATTSTIHTDGVDATLSGVVSGEGGLTKAGASTLTLTAANTYTGNTTISEGTLKLGSTTALGGTASVDIASGATLDLNNQSVTIADLDGAGDIALGSATLTTGDANSHAISGAISGTGALNKSGAGTLTLTGANSYSGGTTVSTGTLIGNTASLQGDITNDAAIVFEQDYPDTYAGTISGSGSLTKTGTGTLQFSASNTYTGATTIAAGTLRLGEAVTFASSSINIASGASLYVDADSGFTLDSTQTLGGSGSVTGGLLTVGSGATLAPGNSPGTLTFTSGLTLDAGSILNFELGTVSDLIAVTGGTLTGPSSGTVTLNLSDSGGFTAGTYTLFDYTSATLSDFDTTDFALGTTIAGYDYSFNLTGTALQLIAATSAVPEPSTYAAILGLGALGFVAWRKRHL